MTPPLVSSNAPSIQRLPVAMLVRIAHTCAAKGQRRGSVLKGKVVNVCVSVGCTAPFYIVRTGVLNDGQKIF